MKVLVFLILVTPLKSLASEPNKISLYGYGGDNPISEDYLTEASYLGSYLGLQHITPIVGCFSEQGNINEATSTCISVEGNIESVITRDSEFLESANNIGSKIYAANYEHLKKHMIIRGNAYVILPCGIGGLGAALDILHLKEQGMLNKPIYFYNQKFWQPVLENLNKLVGPLPAYIIINNPSEISYCPLACDPINQPAIEEYFDEQYEAVQRHTFSLSNATSHPKISLKLLSSIIHLYYARMTGILTSDIILSGSDITSKDNTITFGISPWMPLQRLLTHMYEQGFIKTEDRQLLKFSH